MQLFKKRKKRSERLNEKIAESIFKRKDTPSLYATASQQWIMCMHLCSIDEKYYLNLTM